MKTKTTSTYYKPDLEAVIDQKIKLIEQRILIVSVAYAEKRQPPLESEDIGPFFQEFHVQYEELLIIANDNLQTNNLEANRIKDNEQARNDLAELQNQLAMAQEGQLRQDSDPKSVKRPYHPTRPIIAWAAVMLLSLGDALVNRPSFSAWGYNLLETYAMSVALGAVLAIIAHYFESIVRKGNTIWKQRAIAATIMIVMTIAFWYLADVRAKYLSELVAANTGTNGSFSAAPFTLLSILLFGASVLICHFWLPKSDQRTLMLDYEQQIEEQRQRVCKIEKLEAAIREIEAKNDEMNKLHNSLQEYGAMLEHRIVMSARHGLELWKKHNFLHRSDGRPKSFDNPEYPFEFKRFFNHVNLM